MTKSLNLMAAETERARSAEFAKIIKYAFDLLEPVEWARGGLIEISTPRAREFRERCALALKHHEATKRKGR